MIEICTRFKHKNIQWKHPDTQHHKRHRIGTWWEIRGFRTQGNYIWLRGIRARFMGDNGFTPSPEKWIGLWHASQEYTLGKWWVGMKKSTKRGKQRAFVTKESDPRAEAQRLQEGGGKWDSLAPVSCTRLCWAMTWLWGQAKGQPLLPFCMTEDMIKALPGEVHSTRAMWG